MLWLSPLPGVAFARLSQVGANGDVRGANMVKSDRRTSGRAGGKQGPDAEYAVTRRPSRPSPSDPRHGRLPLCKTRMYATADQANR